VKRKVNVLFRVETKTREGRMVMEDGYISANNNRYCIIASNVVGTVVPTVRLVTSTASELIQ